MKLNDLGRAVRERQDGGKVAVITDSNVAPLYLETCLRSLREAGFAASGFVVPAGEASKSGGTYLALLNKLAAAGLTRSDGVAALGGGVVGDLAGFAAATYMRGIKLYQIPTTLLAMVDSSIGGKTGIDLAEGKNLAGAFHMPELILRDPSVLATLPEEVFREGMAEVVKYGVICDEALFAAVERAAAERNLAGAAEGFIETCAAIKERYVEADPLDRGVRNELNFGHTVGHALEQLSGYELPHGFAVAAGMDCMAQLSAQQGWCSAETYDRLHALLTGMGYDTAVHYDRQAVAEAILADKKRSDDTIRLVTLDRIGACTVREIRVAELQRLLIG
ncbi:MAG: 3-dehydroquinate synthase [Mogibacterium sp.]|nr:3-dehydroquinate synthase [Mogibacterium sp.]